ncbi:MAG: hypothetical protein RL235_499 [Chlamydiota bacterium]|jgi:putative Holliday junction resolvase
MGRIVAIDFGLTRIGLAISDANKMIALPLTTLDAKQTTVATYLQNRLHEIELFVIGLPLNMNGTKGDMAIKVEQFGQELERLTQKKVVFLDERLSSRHAETELRELSLGRKARSKAIDETAATLLLQTYLEQL